ncbi:MAG: oligopeptide transporter, OPT family [Verrucomicrobiota bacterium]
MQNPEPPASRPAPPPAFEPYIPASVRLPEFTVRALILGTILGIVFGASSLYLVLKVGLTVSASIPVAVISVALFRLASKLGVKDATILENNIVQTAGSAGESIAFGIGVTMPAIMILGFDLEISRVMLVAVLGGLLGILMMIPLRRALIVQQHGQLKYPEGTACAEVLKAGASAESKANASASAKKSIQAGEISARTIFAGFGIGLAYKTVMLVFKGWKEVPEKIFGGVFKSGSVSAEISPELLGVGYIIGPRIASIMCAGGVLSYLVLIPMIKFFGDNLTEALPPGRDLIKNMGPDEIRGAYILYIGAGAVAAGGIISLFRSLPTLLHGLKAGLADFQAARAGQTSGTRTETDLSMKFVIGGIVVLLAAILAASTLHMNLLGAVLIVVFGFLFVTVSSRLTGEIGSSSNPISGMTVATLLLTCLIFLVLGWTGPGYFVTALSVGGIVCIAASNGGTTSQDLKTGFLVGATPRLQQIAILLGALASALVLGPILLRLNDAATVYVPRVTLEPESALRLDARQLASLKPWTAQPAPPQPGDYRELLVTGENAAVFTNLTPGCYAVEAAGKAIYRRVENYPATLQANPAQITRQKTIAATAGVPAGTYDVWYKTDDTGGPAGCYLINAQGAPVCLSDPGINGTHKFRPDGSEVQKFVAPKATLMSYIIKGILDRRLPWALVILGVMIAVTLELCGISSLAFAVGVYLPLSSSTPIFVGGLIRWLVDRHLRRRLKDHDLTEEQLVAEGDKSPGVLMASGYIAGGAIAGIVIAFCAVALSGFNTTMEHWAMGNPFYNGAYSDALSLLPFALLGVLLYWAGHQRAAAAGAP